MKKLKYKIKITGEFFFSFLFPLFSGSILLSHSLSCSLSLSLFVQWLQFLPLFPLVGIKLKTLIVVRDEAECCVLSSFD